MKTENLKNWQTTIPALVGGLIVIFGAIYPDKIDIATGEVIETAVSEICIGVGTLISVITGIFAKK